MMYNTVAGLLLVISASLALLSQFTQGADNSPDVGLNTIQIIRRHGYPAEVHVNVQTPDGYLLDIHRIPHGINNANQTNKSVVLLMHGLLSSSADWVNMGREKSIAYQLADAGYDVWMGNARGSTWSRKHMTYNPNKDSEFWDFSWHNIGVTDLPTIIDYILRFTKQEKLFYVGHSQGTTSFFVMASEKPEYNAKIRLMVALAPIAYMSRMTNPFLQLVSLFQDSLVWIMKFLGMDEFLPSTDLLKLIGQVGCNDKSLFQEVCSSVYFLIGGWNSAQLNQTMIPVILTNAPAGSSTKQLIHYGQEIGSGKFCQYDYGLVQNFRRYGTTKPPVYRIGNIVAPVALFYSANDWLAAVDDVNQLANELPNLAFTYLVPDLKFNHLDFLFAIDVRKLLYNNVLYMLERF